jgi:hypothetical protein
MPLRQWVMVRSSDGLRAADAWHFLGAPLTRRSSLEHQLVEEMKSPGLGLHWYNTEGPLLTVLAA